MPGDITPRTSRASRVFPPGQPRPGGRPGHPVSWRRDVGRAADDLFFAGAGAHPHQAQLVRTRVRADSQHLGHQHTAQLMAARLDALHLQPHTREDLRGGGGVQLGAGSSSRSQFSEAFTTAPSPP